MDGIRGKYYCCNFRKNEELEKFKEFTFDGAKTEPNELSKRTAP